MEILRSDQEKNLDLYSSVDFSVLNLKNFQITAFNLHSSCYTEAVKVTSWMLENVGIISLLSEIALISVQ